MKLSFKCGFVLAAMILAAMVSQAEMAQRVLQASVVTTNTDTIAIKGEIGAIGVVIPAAFTADVSVATSVGQTLFSKSSISGGTNWYYPRTPIHTYAGAAITEANSAATNAIYGPFAVVGDVTAKFISSVGTTGTCQVIINYVK